MSELQVGDTVYIEDSAQDDCTLEAWNYIETHRKGTVVQIISTVKATRGPADRGSAPEKEVQCAVDFGAEFPGGHCCTAQLSTRRGQYITAKHLSLCFEESREVITIPNIGGV